MTRLWGKFPEHYDNKEYCKEVPFHIEKEKKITFNKEDEDKGRVCIKITPPLPDEEHYKVSTSYFIGIDWLPEEEWAVSVYPKLDLDKDSDKKTDVFSMLFNCLKHPHITEKDTDELYHIKFDKPYIAIEKERDYLTPLLLIHYLQVLKRLVKKGIKKGYYKKSENLHSRIKGKIHTSYNIKHNTFKPLLNYCSYDEFGVNTIENRILKKALLFTKKTLGHYKKNFLSQAKVEPLLHYCDSAFEKVDDEVGIWQLKSFKSNAFYKEYDEALRLAKLILKRFAYNLKSTEENTVKIPPFWIDMTRLFELYVLGLLMDSFSPEQVDHHVELRPEDGKKELDFLLKSEDCKMVIDAKYKTWWKNAKWEDKTKKDDIRDDIRQVSGYARLEKVYEKLGIKYPISIDCLIVYPDLEAKPEICREEMKKTEVNGYYGIYKLGVRIPQH